ncbi:MAG: hypothetical protein HPY76_11700 [Anaerolineae bacterium]|nr:hypothetical protein [Anaerolineae bacterium]
MRIPRLFSKPFSLGVMLSSLVLSLLATNFIFISIIQKDYPFLSLRRMAYTLPVMVLAWLLSYVVIRSLPKARSVVGERNFRILALICAITSVLIILVTSRSGRQYFNTLFYPVNDIHITALEQKNAKSDGQALEISLFDNQFGYTSFSQFQVTGDWTRTDADSYHLESQDRPASIAWQGRTGLYAVIEFSTGPACGMAGVSVNGQEPEDFDLYAPTAGKEVIYLKFDPVLVERVTSIASQFAVLFIILLVSGVLLNRLLVAIGRKHRRRLRALAAVLLQPAGRLTDYKGYWLLYALPMVLVWGAGLLALSPGLLSPDSMTHFQQAWQGGYDDWHSVLYILLIAGLTLVVRSPAVVAVCQVLAFAVIIAWGLRFLDRLGVPFWVPWLVSILMATALPNILTVNTIWKDVPYALSVFGLTIIFLRIVQTNGAWLEVEHNWVSMGVVAIAIVLFRQNGLFVPLVSYGVLVLLYPHRWRRLLASLALTVLSLAIFMGPVYRLLDVNNTARYKVNEITLHHLAAHYAAGTPISDQERAFLYQMLPPSEWSNYNCATVNNLFFNPQFDRAYMKDHTSQATQLLMRLFVAAPGVDLRHMLCASELVWRVDARSYLVESAFDLDTGKWVVDNSLGIQQDSHLPRLAAFLEAWLRYLDQRENSMIYNLTWRPAYYLYAALFCWGILAVRRQDYRFFLALTPLLAHAITLIFVNFGQEFRYQYPAFILGIYGLGLLLVKTDKGDSGDVLHAADDA